MNQPISVEEHKQHGLDNGPPVVLLWSKTWYLLPLERHSLCFQVISIHSCFITSYSWEHTIFVISSSPMVSANRHVIILLLHCQKMEQEFHWNPSSLKVTSSSFMTHFDWYSILCNLSDSQTFNWYDFLQCALVYQGSSSKDRCPLLKWKYHWQC